VARLFLEGLCVPLLHGRSSSQAKAHHLGVTALCVGISATWLAQWTLIVPASLHSSAGTLEACLSYCKHSSTSLTLGRAVQTHIPKTFRADGGEVSCVLLVMGLSAPLQKLQ
jgi:hypothetical protein